MTMILTFDRGSRDQHFLEIKKNWI